MKTISILIAAYKADTFLQNCLESVRQQVLPAGWQLEILLGIDGCQATLNKAKALNFDDVKIIEMKDNYGTYVTFNTLMQYATGDLFGRFDADDVMNPGFIAEQIKQLEDSTDLTLCWSIYTDIDLQPTSYVMAHSHYHPQGGLNRRGCEGCYIAKREVWQSLGSFRAWPCGADTDFLRRAKLKGFKVKTVEQFLYMRRTHFNSLTAHPTTNFESDLRKDIIAKTEQYGEQYRQGTRDLRVDPVYGEVAAVYG